MLCVVGSLGLCFGLSIPVDFFMYCRFVSIVLSVVGSCGLCYVLKVYLDCLMCCRLSCGLCYL